MSSRLNALCLSAFLALGFLMTKPAKADEWNKKTEFQFNEPVQIPGKMLSPGKYVFELLDSGSNRNTVLVFAEDSNGKESLVTIIQAVPAHVSKTPDRATIQFEERPVGTPEAIHSWFYPGDNTGWGFIYPQGQSL